MGKKIKRKILFVSPVPVEGAGCRFRIYQYLPYLRRHNIKVVLSPFLFTSYFRIVYNPGKVFLKIIYFLLSTLRRLYDLVRAPVYDIIFIYRESYPVGPPIFEYLLHFFGKSIICDFDDAIFLPNTSYANRFLKSWRRHRNIDKIIQLSDCVIAGNEYLKNYALRFHKNVFVLPTVVDTHRYMPAVENKQNVNGRVVIGWIGSPTTQDYVESFIPIFKELRRRNKNIFLKIIGSNFKSTEGFGNNVILQKWFLERELKELQDFDIGIMPMPNNDWTRGKCGFKAILCMSVGVPIVCSKVGVNCEIVQDGINGFLANSEKEWVEKLTMLIENSQLRQKIGQAGRKTVQEKFSAEVNAPKILSLFEGAYQSRS